MHTIKCRFLFVIFPLLLCFNNVWAVTDARLKVTTTPLSRILISVKKSAPATVVSLNYAVIGSQISAQIEKILVQAGDEVKQGALLLELDCRQYELAEKQAKAALQATRAQLKLSEKQYQRNHRLRKQNTIADSILEQSELQAEVSRADISIKQAALEQAQLAVEHCKIRAPFSGQVTEKLVSVGQLVAPHSPVLKLLQTQPVEITAELTPTEILDIQQVEDHVFVYKNNKLPVIFRAINKEIKSASKTQRVMLKPEKQVSDSTLIAGLTGRLQWQSKAAFLPADYLLRRQGKLGVMILQKPASKTAQAIARFHELPNAREGQPALIDLPGDTLVIDSNRFRLKPDEQVDWQRSPGAEDSAKGRTGMLPVQALQEK